MKVAFPIEDKIEPKISNWFGICSFILIKDLDKKDVIIDNSKSLESNKAGIKAAQKLIHNKVNILITLSIGEKAINKLRSAGIQIYEAVSDNMDENLNCLKKGNLIELKESNK